MSSNASKSSFAATLGLILVWITTVVLLIGLGGFAIQCLGGMMSHPQEAGSPVATGSPSAPKSPAGPSETAAQVPGGGTTAPATAGAAPNADPAVAALLATGKQTFQLCAACHGPDGKALVPNMAPNLAGSAYINGPSERLAMIVLNGIQYPGKYLGQMISWKAQFTDEQIAGVLTYVRSNFGNSAPPITPAMIKGAREKHGSRNTPYSRTELDQVLTDLK